MSFSVADKDVEEKSGEMDDGDDDRYDFIMIDLSIIFLILFCVIGRSRRN